MRALALAVVFVVVWLVLEVLLWRASRAQADLQEGVEHGRARRTK